MRVAHVAAQSLEMLRVHASLHIYIYVKKLLGPSVRVPPSLQADKDFTMATFSPCRGFALLLLLCPHFLNASPTPDELVIDTEGGTVQGKLIPSLGDNIRAFLGIPYGKPPVGELRFNPPQPAESWEGVLDATQYSDSCYQIPDDTFPGFFGSEMWRPNTPLSEDCLHLNVWAPRFKKDAPLAHVLVWVYGGAFTSGTASLPLYDGRYLSETEDVIIVSMNYRVGVLGFLTTPADEGLPGNAGLMDQRLALQWVANNIAAFGGDPTKVTLFGESAGSASVGFQLISPGSQSFFTRAVMQSGVPSAPWAVLSQEETWRRSTKLAELLGCPPSSPADMKVCLQQAHPQDLLNNMYNTLIVPEIVPIPFAPYVDGHFLPDTVEALISAGKLPKKDVMFGINQNEGTYFLIYTVAGFSNIGDSIITRDEFLSGVPITMSYSSDVAREMATFQYTDWTDENDGMKNRDALGAMVGDQMIACPALEFARRYSLHGGKTFVYSFDHRSTINVWPEWMGVMHGYEIEFVFGMPLNASLGYTEKEVDMSKKFMKHWANFARSGNPGIDGDWPTFTDEKQEYVTLNTNAPEAKMRLKAKECQLWNTFLPKIQKATDDLETCVAAKQ